jgi:hypothetical protein
MNIQGTVHPLKGKRAVGIAQLAVQVDGDIELETSQR